MFWFSGSYFEVKVQLVCEAVNELQAAVSNREEGKNCAVI